MGFKDRLGTQTLRVWAGCKATVEVNCYAPVSGQIAATVFNGLPQFGDIIDRHSIIIIWAKLHTGPVGVLELPQNRLHDWPVRPAWACHQHGLWQAV